LKVLVAITPDSDMATPQERLGQKAPAGTSLSSRLGTKQQNPELNVWKKLLRGTGNVATEVTQPFVSLAGTPLQAIGKVTGLGDPFQGRQIPGLGDKSNIVSPLSLKAKTGDVLKAGATTAAVAFTPASLVGAIGAGAAIGTATGAGGALQEEKSLMEAGKEGLTGGITGAATGGVLYGAGKLIQKIGKTAYQAVIPTSKTEAIRIQSYKASNSFLDRVKGFLVGGGKEAPRTAADTAFEQGLKGTESMLGVQAKRASGNIWQKTISPALAKTEEGVDMDRFFIELADDVAKSTPEKSRQKALMEAVDAMYEDYKGTGVVPLTDLQKFKEGWAELVPDKAYQGKPIAAAFREIQDEAANKARKLIYGKLGNEVKQAYIDYGNLKAIQELGQVAMTGGRLKGGFGGFWSAVKDMTLTPITTVGGRTVYRVGQGIELLGPAGARVVSDILDLKTLQSLSGETEAK
jgi:hypothetical protein